jgi:hypothetical protein
MGREKEEDVIRRQTECQDRLISTGSVIRPNESGGPSKERRACRIAKLTPVSNKDIVKVPPWLHMTRSGLLDLHA